MPTLIKPEFCRMIEQSTFFSSIICVLNSGRINLLLPMFEVTYHQHYEKNALVEFRRNFVHFIWFIFFLTQ